MSRYSSISLRAESGTGLNLAMTFTLVMWGEIGWVMDDVQQMFRYGGLLHLGTMLGTKAAEQPSESPWHTSAGLETTSSCLLSVCEFSCFCWFFKFGWFGWFCWFFTKFMISDCSTVSVAVFVVVAPHWAPIFCSLQDRLRPLPVKQTQWMQPFKLFIQPLLHRVISKINVGYHTV